MGWNNVDSPTQQSLFSCSPEENDLLNIITSNQGIHIDKIHALSKMPFQKVNEMLMKLELEGVISAKPGNIYFN